MQLILGNDFLHKYNLLSDLRGQRLLDATTTLTAKGCSTITNTPALTRIDGNNAYHDILRKYIEVTLPTKYSEPQHPVRHYIITKGPPCTDHVRKLSPEKYKYAKREIGAWIADGIVRPLNSPYSSAMLMQPKKDGSWKICKDYRRLNRITVLDRYPVSHLRDFAHKLHGRTIFSTLDLERAYFNILIAPKDREKMALITPFGLYEFNVMLFEYTNAAQTFQRFMDNVLRGLDFCFCYIDDILIALKIPEERRNHLTQILTQLQKHGLTIKQGKCVFGKSEAEYLGYQVTLTGIKSLEHRIRPILDYPKPKNIFQLRRFLGMVKF